MEVLLRELRYGFRILTRSPAFSAIAVLTLALGIGASTAIYSVVDAVLLRPLPYPQPQQLVALWENAPGHERMDLADANFADFRAQNHTLTALAEYSYSSMSVAGGSDPVRITGAEVSRDFFTALRVQPFLGRLFVPEELQLNGVRAVIVSYGYWQKYLGARTDLSQFQLAMNGSLYSVVGVMPRGFDFPQKAALWIAREIDPPLPSRTAHNYECLGRLKYGVTMSQARADLDEIAKRIHSEYGKKADLTDATVLPLADAIVGDVRVAVLTLFGAVILLFLVACANVAGLLLARTSARKKELAVRLALGAGRWRLLQQLLAEALILSLAGAVLGILIATWTAKLLPHILPADLPRQDAISINASVLLFTLVVSLAATLGLGLFAAWHVGGDELGEALSASSRGYSGASQKARSVLVIGEIAVTLVILTTAGLLGRSFLRVISVDPGFGGQELVILKFPPPQSEASLTLSALTPQEIARQSSFLNEALTRLQAIPGIQSAGLTGGLPIADADGFPDGTFLILSGQPAPTDFEQFERLAENPSQTGHAIYCAVSTNYFRTLGVPLVRGRMFDEQDGPDAPNVALISDTLARQRWANQNPLGQVIEFGNMDGNLKPLTIVGVVGDVRAFGLDQPPSSMIYVNVRQRGLTASASPTIVLRTKLAATSFAPGVRDVFRAMDPNIPVEFSTFAQALGGWLAERRFLFMLAAVFAGVALALAAVGVYGLVALSVARRMQEIGIRLALGAQRSSILRLIIGEGGRLAVVGVLIGLAISSAATRLISSLLFEVKALDWLTFLTVALLLVVVALLASFIPARHAMRLDPYIVLRDE